MRRLIIVIVTVTLIALFISEVAMPSTWSRKYIDRSTFREKLEVNSMGLTIQHSVKDSEFTSWAMDIRSAVPEKWVLIGGNPYFSKGCELGKGAWLRYTVADIFEIAQHDPLIGGKLLLEFDTYPDRLPEEFKNRVTKTLKNILGIINESNQSLKGR